MATIAEFVGIPYAVGGRTRAGADCWGLVVLIAREVYGYSLPEHSEKSWRGRIDSSDVAAVAAAEAEKCESISAGAEAPGDLVLMTVGALPTHIGIVVEPGLMAHSEAGKDSVISEYRNAKYAPRIVGFYRWKGPRNA